MFKQIPIRLILACGLWFASLSAYALSFKTNVNYCKYEITAEGKIEAGDATRFEQLQTSLEKKARMRSSATDPLECGNSISRKLVITSPGGSVDEAIAIGRILRAGEYTTEAGQCASSCVLIFVGGTLRFAYHNQIGIHRFYFSDLDSQAIESIKSKRAQVREKIKRYLTDMDVSERVLDLSESTPPESIRWLSVWEVQELRIDGEDASTNEKRIATWAKRYGITSAEYRARRYKSEQCAKSEDVACNAHIFGTTYAIMKKIFERKSKSDCYIYVDWNKNPPRSYDDAFERYYNCLRENIASEQSKPTQGTIK